MKTFNTTNVQIKDMTLSKSWYLVDYVGHYCIEFHQFVFERPVDKENAWQLIDSKFTLDGLLYPVYGNWLVFHENAHKCYFSSRLHIWSKRDCLKYERTVAYPELLRKTC